MPIIRCYESTGARGRAARVRCCHRRCARAERAQDLRPAQAVHGGRSDESPTCARRSSRDATTSREIVQQYLTRIAHVRGRLNAAITVNPNALDEADALDRERAAGRIRGPLHGIPIALKDNIHTTDMPTTGGALAFGDLVPPYEATLTKNLRDAGAIIIAKTGLTELANWVAGAPTPMPGNYNGLAGYGMNPYDPRRDPREATFDGRPVLGTGGSSSGIGTAASFWAGNVGTETSGSILSPSNQNMLVGIKPTVGRISRYGVIPITADQDTPGPMARTVTDAAIMLGAMESAAPDPNDPATRACPPPPRPRLHEIPEPRRAEGRAHRHSARVLLRPRDAAGTDRAARRPERRAGEGDGRGDRGAEAAGRRHRRSRRHPERRRHGSEEQLAARGTRARAPTKAKARTRTARSRSSTA